MLLAAGLLQMELRHTGVGFTEDCFGICEALLLLFGVWLGTEL